MLNVSYLTENNIKLQLDPILATLWYDRNVLPKSDSERKIAKNSKTNFKD